MTAEKAPELRDVLILRAEARATLWRAGEYELSEAVDELQAWAQRVGLIDEIGQNDVQEILATAFADPPLPDHHPGGCDICGCDPCQTPGFCNACRAADARALLTKAEPQRPTYTTAQSTLDAAAWLVFQNGDAEHFNAWLQQHPHDRDAIQAHIEKLKAARHARNQR